MLRIAIADDDSIFIEAFTQFFAQESELSCEWVANSIDQLMERLGEYYVIDYSFFGY